jgi:hypothetical protein
MGTKFLFEDLYGFLLRITRNADMTIAFQRAESKLKNV